MLSRRSFMASISMLMAFRVAEARAEWGKEIVEWLVDTVKEALPSLDQALDFLLRSKHDLQILLSGRDLIQDVRRRLTDSTPERHLEVRLGEWLRHHDAWVNEKQRSGESDADFAARRERERLYLQADWQACKGDAIAALLDIKYLGDELQNINQSAMPSEEWRTYKRLLDDEKTLIEAINVEMPTEPYIIDRLREVAERLGQIVRVIDENAADLDNAIKKAG